MPYEREKAAIGRRLRVARESVGASLEEAAEAANVQPTAIRAWEAGRTLPHLVQFRGLLTAYGGTGHQIIFGADPFEMSEGELRELLQIVRRHGTPALKRRMDVIVTVVGRAAPPDTVASV